MNWEWLHAAVAAAGFAVGALGTAFTGGWRLGRIEERLKLHFRESLFGVEKQFEDKLDQASNTFDETLKALRQKINDVELDSERRFLPKAEFSDFREEYREDVKDLKAMIMQANKR